MKIIAVNKYYYLDGGPERYLFSLSDYLASLGHEVIPFAVAYEKNDPSAYEAYFVRPAGSGTGTKLDQLEGGIGTRLRIAARSIYSVEAKRALEKLIDDTGPDVVYALNIVNHMSPSIIDAAHGRGVPVVMRLSDYNLICPSYLFLRDGKLCTECERGYYHALRHKCVYGSISATLCRVLGMYAHRITRVYDKVSAFVAPARFMRDMLVRAGLPAEKIHHIPTFVDSARWTPRYDSDGHVLYFGRLTPEKGVGFLLRAYRESGIEDPLLIVGSGPARYVEQLKGEAAEDGRVSFLGQKSGRELQDIVRGARYVVVPSLWYDNTPNVVYEAFAAGKPVIATALGGLCEQITPETGVLVEPGDVQDLAAAISRMSSSPELLEQMGRSARRRVEEVHSIRAHVDRLLELFTAIAGVRARP